MTTLRLTKKQKKILAIIIAVYLLSGGVNGDHFEPIIRQLDYVFWWLSQNFPLL